jgi:hypothetical protein
MEKGWDEGWDNSADNMHMASNRLKCYNLITSHICM